MVLGLFKTMVFAVRITHCAVSDELQEHFVSTLFSEHALSFDVSRLLRFRAAKKSSKWVTLFPANASKFNPTAKELPRGPNVTP